MDNVKTQTGEKVKLKNAQTVLLASKLFAHVISVNAMEGKKAFGVIGEFQNELKPNSKSILPILKLFANLKNSEHCADISKLQELVKMFSSLE